jgi:hypothetical protein
MGLLDNLLETVKKGVEVAREKGEQGVNTARLHLEIANLNRERDGFYQRLGRMYVQNPNDHALLDPLVDEVKRVGLEIEEREAALIKLGETPQSAKAGGTPGVVNVEPKPDPEPTKPAETPPHP